MTTNPKETTMTATTMQLFAETMEKTAQWLEELTTVISDSEPRRAYSVLRAVLRVLRDRLTVDEAVNLGAQLPMLIRGVYYEGWRPTGRPLKHRHKAEFLGLVAKAYPDLTATELEPAARAVFKLLSRHVTAGEIGQVWDQLPAEVRSLWDLAA
jgi:uncharacterized protein (DUF2267 family)